MCAGCLVNTESRIMAAQINEVLLYEKMSNFAVSFQFAKLKLKCVISVLKM